MTQQSGGVTLASDFELAVLAVSSRMQAATRVACTPGAEYAHRSLAFAHLAEMTALINSRSDDDIARMERERGLV